MPLAPGCFWKAHLPVERLVTLFHSGVFRFPKTQHLRKSTMHCYKLGTVCLLGFPFSPQGRSEALPASHYLGLLKSSNSFSGLCLMIFERIPIPWPSLLSAVKLSLHALCHCSSDGFPDENHFPAFSGLSPQTLVRTRTYYALSNQVLFTLPMFLREMWCMRPLLSPLVDIKVPVLPL